MIEALGDLIRPGRTDGRDQDPFPVEGETPQPYDPLDPRGVGTELPPAANDDFLDRATGRSLDRTSATGPASGRPAVIQVRRGSDVNSQPVPAQTP